MSINLSKLTPAPWVYHRGMDYWRVTSDIKGKDNGEGNEADYQFIALARNAFDVMMRRGWHAVKGQRGWKPQTHAPTEQHCKELNKWAVDKWYDDPFTALVEADKWYRENVENEGGDG